VTCWAIANPAGIVRRSPARTASNPDRVIPPRKHLRRLDELNNMLCDLLLQLVVTAVDKTFHNKDRWFE
jgi:hypothetical protein